MSSTVVVIFPLREGLEQAFGDALKTSLVDTRAYDGCKEVRVYFDKSDYTYVLIEEWETSEHHARYHEWRLSTGMEDAIKDILASPMRIEYLGEPLDI